MSTPLHVLGGPLGAGKTTLLLRQLEERNGRERVAVVVNDFGDARIDASLVEGAGGEEALPLAEIHGACVCCTAPAGLVAAVTKLLDEVRPDRIFVEPSGAARAVDVLDTLARSSVAPRLALKPLVVAMDMAFYQNDPEATREALSGADVIVLTKVDQLHHQEDGDALREQFRRFVATLWPVPLMYFEIPLGYAPAVMWDWLPNEGPLRERGLERVPPSAEPLGRPGDEVQRLAHHAHGHDHAHDHGHAHAHDHGSDGACAHDHEHGADCAPAKPSAHEVLEYGSRIWPVDVRFSRDRLRAALARHADAVSRVKGVFRTDQGALRLDIANGAVSEASSPWRRDSRVDVIVARGATGVWRSLLAALDEARLEGGEGESEAGVLEVESPSGRHRFDRAALAALPGQIPDVGSRFPGRVGQAVPLAALLPEGDGVIVAVARDGFVSAPTPREALGDAVIVYALDGEPLPEKQGGPLRLLGAPGPCANVKGVVRVVVRPA